MWQSRAVLRRIEAGNWVYCAHCDTLLKFRARESHEQIICNVYDNGVWQRVEHYHPDCYKQAGEPYGAPS